MDGSETDEAPAQGSAAQRWLMLVGGLLILVLGFTGGMTPYWIARQGRALTPAQQKFMGLGNMFAGGVLLAAGLCHMLPDLVHASLKLGLDGPTPFLFVMAGLLIPFALDQSPLVQRVLTTGCMAVCVVGGSHEDGVPVRGGLGAHQPLEAAESDADNAESAVAATTGLSGASEPIAGGLDVEGEVGESACGDGKRLLGCDEASAAHASDAAVAAVASSSAPGATSQKELLALLLVLVLAVHSLMEGVGIGVQTEIASSVGILLAVVGHKWFAAFALGMSFRRAGATAALATKGVALFAVMTPLGMLLGVLLKQAVASAWVDVVSVGLAAGTFVYVAVIEILQGELSSKGGHSHDAQPGAAPSNGERPAAVADRGGAAVAGPDADRPSADDGVAKAAAFGTGIVVFTILGYFV